MIVVEGAAREVGVEGVEGMAEEEEEVEVVVFDDHARRSDAIPYIHVYNDATQ